MTHVYNQWPDSLCSFCPRSPTEKKTGGSKSRTAYRILDARRRWHPSSPFHCNVSVTMPPVRYVNTPRPPRPPRRPAFVKHSEHIGLGRRLSYFNDRVEMAISSDSSGGVSRRGADVAPGASRKTNLVSLYRPERTPYLHNLDKFLIKSTTVTIT